MITITPKTKIGKRSVYLIVAMPLLFIAGSFLSVYYQNAPASDTIWEDVINRPFLSLTMIVGMGCGLAAFVTGLMAIIREKERGILIYFSVVMGALLIFFLLGEIISPH